MKLMESLYTRKCDRFMAVYRNIFNFLQLLAFCFVNSLLQIFIAFLDPLPSGNKIMYGQQVNGGKENAIFYENVLQQPSQQNTQGFCFGNNCPQA